MKNAIILHGLSDTYESLMKEPSSPSNSHWFPWLQWELIKRDIFTQTPEMPKPYMPDINYDAWARVFGQFEINDQTILIGHSCGGGHILKYLSLNPQVRPAHLILVAPWIDVDGDHPTFFKDFDPDVALPNRVDQIDLLYSTDDMDIVVKSVDKIKQVYGDKINYHEFANKGHFCLDDIGLTFPELLKIIKKGTGTRNRNEVG